MIETHREAVSLYEQVQKMNTEMERNGISGPYVLQVTGANYRWLENNAPEILEGVQNTCRVEISDEVR